MVRVAGKSLHTCPVKLKAVPHELFFLSRIIKMSSEAIARAAVAELLDFAGDNPEREGLLETPDRVVRSFGELYSGYGVDPEGVLKAFDPEDVALGDNVNYDEIVLVKDIEIFSTCLSGDTFIETPRGRIPIKYLKDGEFVYCWDEENCKMTLQKCENPRITGKQKKLWRVYTDKDTILCTPDHKFLTHNRGWIEACQLKTSDSVVALNKGTRGVNNKQYTYLTYTGMEKQIPEHRFVFSEINGEIDSASHIHHIDENTANNSPSNLQSMSVGEHSRLHRNKNKNTGFALISNEDRLSFKKKQVDGVKRSQTVEVKKKRSDSLKKYWDSLSPEQREARNHRVLISEPTDWVEDVWCMDVPKYHNFVANGMVVHNCEHHMLPFFGKAHIAYMPTKKVLGVSKLVRLMEVFARRLQIQERIGKQITNALMEYGLCSGAACVIEAQHFCMVSRGVQKQNSKMVTSSMQGCFLENAKTRQELMMLIKG